MSKVLISSNQRYQGTSSSGNVKMTNRLNGYYRLLEFDMTNNLFNVDSNNNKVYVNASSVDYILTLTSGYHTLSQLKTELQTQLNTIPGHAFTVTLNSKTSKFTITETGGNNFYFNFSTTSSNSANKLIGFSTTTAAASSSQTSDISADICPHKYFFCRFDEDTLKPIESHNHFSTSLMLSGDANYNGVFRYKVKENYQQILNFNHTPLHISYHFHNENDNNLDFQGAEWVMLLERVEI